MLGPLLERELKILSRQWQTWAWRTGLVSAAGLAWALPVMVGRLSTFSGRPAFAIISICPFIYALLTGSLTTADCISREKRDGTLGLLLLTSLRPDEIIQQKLLSAAANTLLSLLAITPLFVLPVVLGGVTGTEVILLMLLVVVTCIWSCSVAALVSVFHLSAPGAMVTSFLAVTAPAAISAAFTALDPSFSFLATLIEAFDPVRTYIALAFNSQSIPSQEISASLMVLLLASLLCLRMAARFLPTRAVKVQRHLHPRDTNILLRILWRDATTDMKIGIGVAALILILFVGQWLVKGPPAAYLAMIGILNFGTKLWITVKAIQIFHSRPWLETVLTTPLPVDEYVQHQLKWCAPRLGVPLAVTFFIDIVLLYQMAPSGLFVGSAHLHATALAALLFLIPDAVVLCLLGFWYGVANSTVNEAAGNVISRVIFLPVAIAICVIALGLRTATHGGGILLWSVMCLLLDTLLGAWAIWLLRHRLRRLVSEK